MNVSYYLPLLVASPLLLAGLILAVGRLIPRQVFDWLAVLLSATGVAAALRLFFATRSGAVVHWAGGWWPRGGLALGIDLYADAFAAAIALLITVLAAAAFLFLSRKFRTAHAHLHVLLLTFCGSMLGFALAGDLFDVFVWFELMTVSAAGLCALKSEEHFSVHGAFNLLITNCIAAFMYVMGVALLYGRTGALNMAQVGRALQPADRLVLMSLALIGCGLLIKGAAVPFHFWLADAHAVAPSPICALFSGVMVPLGIIGALRIYTVVFAPFTGAIHHAAQWLLFASGIAACLLGGFMALAQRHLKRMLAYSTIAHMGILLCAAALFSPVSLGGAGLYVLAHGVLKAALFLCAGILLHRSGTVDEFELYGFGRSMPATAAVYFLAALGTLGLPGFGTFHGESMIGHVAKESSLAWLKILFVLASGLSGAAIIRAGIRIFFGKGGRDIPRGAAHIAEEPETVEARAHSTPWNMWVAAAALLVAGGFLFAGFASREALVAGFQFRDGEAYRSVVLDGHASTVDLSGERVQAEQAERSLPAMAKEWPRLAGVVLLSGGVVWFSLSPHHRSRQLRRTAADVLSPLTAPLRSLHSGAIGDYVAWITAGIAGCTSILLFTNWWWQR